MDQQRKMYRYLAKSSQHVGEAGDTKPYMGALQVTRLTHVRAWVRRVFNTCVIDPSRRNVCEIVISCRVVNYAFFLPNAMLHASSLCCCYDS